MATDRYTVIVDTKGAEGNINKLSTSVGGLKSVLAGAFVVGGITAFVSEMLRVGEVYEQMRKKLSLVTTSQAELNVLLDTLTGISGRTFSSLQGTVELYQRLSIATGDLNVSTPTLLSLTERLQKAFSISGASAEEQARGITQLGQGLLEGKIRMEEFNTIMDTMGLGMVKVAQASGLTVGELRALVRDGELTAEMFLDMVESADSLDEIFSSLSLTTADVRQSLTGTFQEVLNTINEATGASDLFRTSMISLNLSLADFFGTSQSLKELKPEEIFNKVKDGTLNAETALISLQNSYLDTLGVFSGFGIFGSDERAEINEYRDSIKELVEARQADKEAAEAQLKVDQEQQKARAEMLKPLTSMSGQLDAISKAYERNIPKSQKLTTEYDAAEETLAKLVAMRGTEIAQTPEYEKALRITQERLKQLKGEMDGTSKATDKAARSMTKLTESTEDLLDNLKESTEDLKLDLEQLNMTPLQKQLVEIERDIQERVGKQIKKLEEAMTPETAAAVTAQIERLKEAASDAIVAQTKLVEDSVENQAKFSSGWQRAFTKYQEDAQTAADFAEGIFNSATGRLDSAIDKFVDTGKFDLGGLATDILKDTAKSGIKNVANNIISDILGGITGGNQQQQKPQQSSGGGGFSGFVNDMLGFKLFANGGYLPAGQFGIVGERQAEMIMGPASVRPSANGGGGAMNVVINAVDAMSFKALVARDPEFIYAVAQRGSRSYR